MVVFLTMLPATALAVAPRIAYDILWIGNTRITDSGYWTTDGNGNLMASDAGNYNIAFDADTNTLTLNNANIAGQYNFTYNNVDAGIYAYSRSGAVSLTIQVTGNNVVSGSSGIYALSNGGEVSVTISGGGSLTASGSWNGISIVSEFSSAALAIEGTALKASGSYGDGVQVQAGESSSGSLSVNGGSLTASGNTGIYFYFSTGDSGSGIPSLTVAGNAVVDAKGGGIAHNSSNNLSIQGNSGIVFNGSTGTVYGNASLQEDLIIGEGESLTLDNGASLDANGHNVIVDGGILDKSLADSLGESVIYKVTGVSLFPATLALEVGESGPLTATIAPDNATNKVVKWESNDTSVATVDASGLVTAVSAGTTNITATADGNKTATCTVTVVAKTYSISSSPTSLDFGSVYTGYAQPAAQTVVVTNTGNQDVTLVQPASANFEISAFSAITLAPNDTATFSVQPRSGLPAGTYSEQIVVTGTAADGGSATCAATLSFSVRAPYIPPRPTGPDWGDVADDISDAEPGSTVKVDMDGKTVLPGEVLDELAGLDVTLALDMGDGLIWEICGGDVPADAEYDDVDLGVALGGDDIPADVANLVTGESGSVQVSLEHDGPFGFELTLVAPLGEDAAGLVANLYRYDDEAGSLGYEATAQVDGEGVARLPFDHASSWLVALDSRSHALPFPDALEGEWYSEAVRWAWLSGLMTGYGDGPSAGLFGTGDVLTRAQLAAVLYNAAGQPEVDPAGAGAFVDCDPAAWYAEAVAWAAQEGLMTGYTDGTGRFGPEDELTREQLAAVFWRAAGEPAADADLSAFPDGDSTSAWALEPVEWAVETGLLKGYDDTGELDPAGDLTRAQAATVFFRLAGNE